MLSEYAWGLEKRKGAGFISTCTEKLYFPQPFPWTSITAYEENIKSQKPMWTIVSVTSIQHYFPKQPSFAVHTMTGGTTCKMIPITGDKLLSKQIHCKQWLPYSLRFYLYLFIYLFICSFIWTYNKYIMCIYTYIYTYTYTYICWWGVKAPGCRELGRARRKKTRKMDFHLNLPSSPLRSVFHFVYDKWQN